MRNAEQEGLWMPILGTIAYVLIFGFVFATVNGNFDHHSAAAENPAVIEKARATVDVDDNLPFTVIKVGRSLYGINELLESGSSTVQASRPKIFVARDNTTFVNLWKNYIDPDYAEDELNPLGERVAVFVFRGRQDYDGHSIKINKIHWSDRYRGARNIEINVTFENLSTGYPQSRKFCSPCAVVALDKKLVDEISLAQNKQIEVLATHVSYERLTEE